MAHDDVMLRPDPDTVDLVEASLEIFPGPEDVVVATDESFMPHHSRDVRQTSFIDRDVTKKIYMVFWSDDFVMEANHCLVHVLDVIEDTKR